jgi:hypothetical protein
MELEATSTTPGVETNCFNDRAHLEFVVVEIVAAKVSKAATFNEQRA